MPTWKDRIEVRPEVLFGKPAIKGTRISVEHILCKLAAGMTLEEIVAEYPHITVDDIHAAEAFAADYLVEEDIALR